MPYGKSGFNPIIHAAVIPGISIGHHKLGEMKHEKPPKYTDPDEALEYFFKILTQPKVQRQIWDILEKYHGTTWHITRAILFKAAMEGVIQMNLGMVIYPTVQKMVIAIAKAGKVSNLSSKIHPKFTSAQREQYIKQGMKELLLKYDKHGWLKKKSDQPPPPPSPQNSQGEPDATVGAQGSAPQQQQGGPPTSSGIMGMAQSQPNGDQ